MKKLLFIAAVAAAGAYLEYARVGDAVADQRRYDTAKHSEIIMYALTTCGFCRQKAVQFNAKHIEFTEYFIDTDPGRQAEMIDKLMKAGYNANGYGVPVMDVKGVILVNNPPMDAIIQIANQG